MSKAKTSCYLCGHEFSYDTALCGERMRCQNCGGEIVLPFEDEVRQEKSSFWRTESPWGNKNSNVVSLEGTTKYFCPHCGFKFNLSEDYDGRNIHCPWCNKDFLVKLHPDSNKGASASSGQSNDADKTSNSAPSSDTAPSAQEGIFASLKRFFSMVRKNHSFEEAENLFCVGSVSTTLGIMDVDTRFPAPWLYTRVLGGSIIILLISLFTGAVESFGVVGNAFISISALMLFYELNVLRNISFYLLAKVVFLGTLISFLVTGLLSGFFDNQEVWFAGFIEEPAKMIALYLVLKFCKVDTVKYHYKLNGLLFGAAIGFGFEVFENMRYMITSFLHGGAKEAMLLVILRQTNAFWGHIVWSAIAGFALWRIMKKGDVEFVDLFSTKFLPLFAVSVGCHVVHNLYGELGWLIAFGLVFVVCWSVIFALIREGLKEIQEEQNIHGAKQFY